MQISWADAFENARLGQGFKPLGGLEQVPVAQCFEVAGGAWVMGAHGGAGVSTVCAWTGLQDSQRRWPVNEQSDVSVWVCAKTTYNGYLSARELARQWHTGKVSNRLAGLILVPDAAHPAKALRRLDREMVPLFPRVCSLPWIEAVRIGPIEQYQPSAGLRRILEKLSTCAYLGEV